MEIDFLLSFSVKTKFPSLILIEKLSPSKISSS